MIKTWWGRKDRLARAFSLARILPIFLGMMGAISLIHSISASPDTVLDLLADAFRRFSLAVIVWLTMEAAERWMRYRENALPGFFGWFKAPMLTMPGSVRSLPKQLRQSWQLGRILLFSLATLSSAYVWANSTNNYFPPPVIVAWLVSTVLWALAFAPLKWSLVPRLYSKLNGDLRIPWRKYWWAYIAFALIMILGTHFRLAGLDIIPGELTNDIYLNLVDAFDFAQGTETPVYFAYNNGRPLFTFYLAAALASAPGFGVDYYTLKLSTTLSSLAALPLMFWLGYEFAGKERRYFGIVMGLLLSSLVALSFWDAVISRAGGSYALPPFFAALLGVYLIRAIRHNRRGDFVMAGLALGFSLYTYAPTRVYPLAAVVAVMIAIVLRKISLRERMRYLVHLSVLAIVSFMVFLPMFHYMIENPDNFWKRATQIVVNPTANPEEETLVLQRNVATFMNNIRKHLLMYNWGGDGLLGRNLPGAPALDSMTGTLLILGLAALAVRMLRSRDPVIWMLPAVLVIMHIPSIVVLGPDAPSLVPSNTRTLGALPYIYLLAAFPLALIARQLLRTFPESLALLLGVILFGTLLLRTYEQNTSTYFDRYNDYLLTRSIPSSDGGRILRGYFESGGTVGNSFIFYSPAAGEPRFIAAEAGVFYYPNDIWNVHDIPRKLSAAANRDKYKFDANRDMLFLYSPDYQEATFELRRLFPQGHYQEIASSRKNDHSYAVFRVPAIGEEGLNAFLVLNPLG